MTSNEQAKAWTAELIGAASIDDGELVDACGRIVRDAFDAQEGQGLVLTLASITAMAHVAFTTAVEHSFHGDTAAALAHFVEGMPS